MHYSSRYLRVILDHQLSLLVESVSGVVGDDGQQCGTPGWVKADDDAVALGEVEELGDVVDRVGPRVVVDGGVVTGVVQEDDLSAPPAGSMSTRHDAGAGEERGTDLVAQLGLEQVGLAA